jgi:hypothetical protein
LAIRKFFLTKIVLGKWADWHLGLAHGVFGSLLSVDTFRTLRKKFK